MTDVEPTAPASPAEVAPEPNRDREVFDRVVAKYKDKGEAATAPPTPMPTPPEQTPETGRGVEQLTAVPPTPTPEAAKPPADEKKTPEVPPEALTQAKEFLRLKTKARDAALETMTPTEVLDWASDVREREVGVDRSFRERADALKELEELRTKAETDAAEGEPKKGLAPDPDRVAAMDALSSELSLTDEGRTALEKFGEALTAPLRAELAETRTSVTQDRNREATVTLEKTRDVLRERFPGLASDETWRDIYATMRNNENEAMFGGKEGSRFDEYLPRLMESAARFHGLEEKDPQVEAEAKRTAEADLSQRIADGPTVDSRPTPVSPMTKEQDDWKVFQRVTAKRRGSAVG